MRTLLIPVSLVTAIFASACQSGAEVNIEPTQYQTTLADPNVGKIVIDSNAAAAPFTIKSRDNKITIESFTYDELELEAGAYSLEFKSLPEFGQTPPAIGTVGNNAPIQLKKGEEVLVTGIYAP